MSCVPLPWWTSQSRIATRAEPELALGEPRRHGDVVEEAEAHRPVGQGMVARRPPEGEAAALDRLDRRSGRKARQLVARRRANRVRIEIAGASARGDGCDGLDVVALVTGGQLVDRRAARNNLAGQGIEQRPDPLRPLGMAPRRVEAREVRMGQKLQRGVAYGQRVIAHSAAPRPAPKEETPCRIPSPSTESTRSRRTSVACSTGSRLPSRSAPRSRRTGRSSGTSSGSTGRTRSDRPLVRRADRALRPRHGRGDPRCRRGLRPRARRAARAERALGDRPERTLRGRLHGLRGLREGNPRREDDPRTELGLAAVVAGLHGRAPRRAARKALADHADRSRHRREARLQLGRARRLPQCDRHRPARGRRHALARRSPRRSSTRATSARPCTRRRAPDIACAANFLVAQHGNGAVDIEAVPGDMDILLPEHDVLSHTNHLTSLRLVSTCAASASRHSRTHIRGSRRVRRLLEERHGEIDDEAAREILRDHANSPARSAGTSTSTSSRGSSHPLGVLARHEPRGAATRGHERAAL